MDSRAMSERQQDCFQQLLSGDFSHIPPFESNIIRIFLSSTFGDFIHERNKLMHDVFPVLRRMCQKRGVEFDVVDMRWGVTDAAMTHHLTSAICLQEIANCQRLSIGPTFVAFLGNRYGYRPLPSQIPPRDFEIFMLTASRHSTDASVLQVWYLRDDNAVPPAMELQAVTSLLPNYDSSDADLRRKDQDAWWSVFTDLQRLLWQLAMWAVEEGTMTAEYAHRYLMSVTEDEILHGIFESSSPSKHCLCYLREIGDVNLFDNAAYRYIDMSSRDPPTVDIQAQKFLSDLKFKKISDHLESKNISSFSLPWFDGGIDPSLPQHEKYLHDFCSQVHSDLKKMIESSLQNRNKSSALFREVLHHASFCMSKCESFCGCENILSQIRKCIQARTLKPLVLYGASGTGKTSVMAMASNSVRNWCAGTSYCVVRFLGTTPQSSTIRETLISVCHHICTLFNFAIPDFQQMDVHEVVQYFGNTITNVGSQTDTTLAIFLDSVDQLSAASGAHSLKWLPKLLPPNVHIIVSTLPELHGCLTAIQSVITDENCYIKMPSMSIETGIDILESWLAKSNRTITCSQKEVVEQAFAICPQPLYMKLVFHEALKWKSYTSSLTISLPHSVVSAISNFFQLLEIQHGKTLVHHALGYISAAKNGITEAELEDVLSLDDAVLDSVYQYWDPPVTGIVRLPPLLLKRVKHDIAEYIVERMADGKAVLSWYHRQFVEAACRRYLQLSDQSERHALLAVYFEGRWSERKPNPLLLSHRQLSVEVADRQVAPQPAMFSDGVYNIRKLNELSFHLTASGDYKQLKLLTLCNFQWLLVKLLALPFSNLMYDFSAATSAFPNDEELLMLSECISLSATNLRTDPYSLAGQLLGRLLVAATVKYPFVSSLLQQAREWTNSCNLCTIMPTATCLISPGGPLKTTLSAHPFRLDAVMILNLPSGTLAVSVSKASENSAIFNMWDMSSLDCIDISQSVTIESQGTACSPLVAAAGDLLVGAFGNRVILWNARTCEQLQTFTVSEGVKALALSSNKKTLCVLTTTGKVMEVNVKEGSLSIIESEGMLEEICHIHCSSENFLIICSEMGEVQIVNLNTRIVEYVLSVHVKKITCLSVKDYANTSIGVTGSEDCTLAAIDLTHGKIIHKLNGHSKKITCVCQHMLDSSTSIAVSGSLDNSVIIWDIGSGVLLHKCTGHTNAVWCLSLLEPNLVVSGSKDDYLKVWDIESGLCTFTLEGHSSWISCVTATGRDVILSGSNDKKVKVWKLHPPTLPELERHSTQPDCIVANKNGLVISGSQSDIKVWNSFSSSCLHTWQHGASCLATDGCNRLVSGSNKSLVSLWDLVSFNKICDLQGHTGNITSVAVSADHTKIMSASTDHTIHLWDFETCEVLHILKGHCTPIKCMNVSPTGKTLVSGSYSGRICVWDLCTFECEAVLSGHVKVVWCITVLKDDGTIISGSDDCTLRIWNVQEGACIHVVTYKDSVKAIAVSPDNSFVVAGAHSSVDQLRMWDLKTGECLYTFYGHTHAVMCMLLIFDGKFLVTGSRDGTIKVWCMQTSQQCASFDLQSQVKYIALCSESDLYITLAATTKSGPVAFLDVSLPQIGL